MMPILRCTLPSILAGLVGGCFIIGLLFRMISPAVLRRLGLVMLLPGPGFAVALAYLHTTHRWLEGLLIAPAVTFPVAATLLTLPPGAGRVAIGLSATPLTRLRLVWLPLLSPAILVSAMLAVAFSITCALLDHP